MSDLATFSDVVSQHIINETSGRLIQIAPWRRSIKEVEVSECFFCSAALSHETQGPTHSYLVSPFHGAPKDSHNKILVCAGCSSSRLNIDVIGWAQFSRLGDEDSRARALARRDEILQHCPNHLTPTYAGAPRATVLKALRKRWAHPRTKLFAYTGSGGSFIGWTGRCGGRSALGELATILRFGFKANPLSDDRLTLFELPDQTFHDAVWALIDHGAWMVPLRIPEHPIPFDHTNWQHWWQVSMNDIHDLRRRRPRLVGNSSRQPGTLAHKVMKLRARARANEQWEILEELKTAGQRTPVVAPMPPRSFSQTPQAVSMRKRYRKQITEERLRAWLAERHAVMDYKDRVRRGEVLPATNEELRAMDEHVMDLFDLYNTPWPE